MSNHDGFYAGSTLLVIDLCRYGDYADMGVTDAGLARSVMGFGGSPEVIVSA